MKIGIIGGGASGILSAILLKKAHPEWIVSLYEAHERIGQKLLKTGNGRCNLGHSGISPQDYPYDLREELKVFSEETFIHLFKELGIYLFKDNEGRYYPESESSKQVVSILLKHCEELKINIYTANYIDHIEISNKQYIINQTSYDAVIIATGGPSQSPYTGDGIFNDLHLSMVPYKPALVGLKTVENIKALSGVRRKVVLTAPHFKEAGEVQFKDEGVSGIVVMNYSRYTQKNERFYLDLAPHYTEEELKQFMKETSIQSVVNGLFSKALADYVLKEKDCIKAIKSFPLTVKDTYSFNEAQISLGGVATSEIKGTFESQKYPHLYIIGEALDNDGPCGGYNLYFAWLSSYIATLDIMTKLKK